MKLFNNFFITSMVRQTSEVWNLDQNIIFILTNFFRLKIYTFYYGGLKNR